MWNVWTFWNCCTSFPISFEEHHLKVNKQLFFWNVGVLVQSITMSFIVCNRPAFFRCWFATTNTIILWITTNKNCLESLTVSWNEKPNTFCISHIAAEMNSMMYNWELCWWVRMINVMSYVFYANVLSKTHHHIFDTFY